MTTGEEVLHYGLGRCCNPSGKEKLIFDIICKELISSVDIRRIVGEQKNNFEHCINSLLSRIAYKIVKEFK